MWLFQKRAVNVVSNDFEARLTNLEQKFNKVKQEVLDCATDIDTMRDKVLRKIQTRRKDDDEETPPALDGLPRIK